MSLINLAETTLTVKKWLRAKGALISNEYGQAPSIIWDMEWITTDSAGNIIAKTEAGRQKCSLVPGTPLPVINPDTGAKIRDTVIDELYALLYSSFIQARAVDPTPLIN